MAADRLASLIALQDADGFFASDVHGGPDRNGFATVQVLRAAASFLPPASRSAALSALRLCRNESTGAFRFWPVAPSWARTLPDDADDTALMSSALYIAGELSFDELRRLACHTVVRHRLAAVAQPGPPWARIGSFKTWMRPGLDADIADCTVNANVVALLAMADLRGVPGYAEACLMIDEAVRWAADDFDRAASLSPFYPEPGELLLAIEAAVAAGASELTSTLSLMQASSMWRDARARSCAENPVICGSPYGLVRWTSRAVGLARGLAGD